ncbi:MAG: metallophosphoesterase [Christensenellaceae bacterium]|jgi:putative phosphoesterase
MKKSLVALAVSDTHRNTTMLNKIVSRFTDVDYVFHLGDNVSDAHYLQERMQAEVIYVKGNCDFDSNAPGFAEVFLLGQKIILTHGHTLKVKYSYDRALYYAQEHEAQALLFGHTHRAYTEYINGVWLINPGSAGEGRAQKESAARLLITKMGIVPKILDLNVL